MFCLIDDASKVQGERKTNSFDFAEPQPLLAVHFLNATAKV